MLGLCGGISKLAEKISFKHKTMYIEDMNQMLSMTELPMPMYPSQMARPYVKKNASQAILPSASMDSPDKEEASTPVPEKEEAPADDSTQKQGVPNTNDEKDTKKSVK